MANTYTWSINQLEVKLHEDNLENVVYNVHYRYLAQDESDEKIAVSMMGIFNIQYKEGEPFTPFEDLTESQVLEWLENGLNVSEMQDSLNKEIEFIKNPVDKSLTPPWIEPKKSS